MFKNVLNILQTKENALFYRQTIQIRHYPTGKNFLCSIKPCSRPAPFTVEGWLQAF